MVTGIKVSAAQFEHFGQNPCEPCIQAKQHRLPFPDSSAVYTKPGQRFVMDLVGPMPVMSRGGFRYLASYKDAFSKVVFLKPIAHKSDVTQVTKHLFQMLDTQHGLKVKSVRSDNGGEYVNGELEAFFQQLGIFHQKSVPYTPEQNGMSERSHRTSMERIRAMLIEAGLPDDMWDHAALTAAHIINRSPAKGLQKTPIEMLTGLKPDVSGLRVFGARAYVLEPSFQRTKLGSRGVPGRMIGYPIGVKGYRILLDSGKIVVTRDVTFVETADIQKPLTYQPLAADIQKPLTSQPLTADILTSSDEEPEQDPEQDPEPRPRIQFGPAERRYPERARRTADQAPWFERTSMAAVVEPTSLKEAMASEHWEQWEQACNEEIASCHANKTWKLVVLPPGVVPIDLKWVFKLKRDSAGVILRFKARIVARGFQQQEGVNYWDTYAPVTKYTTMRALLAKAAHEDMEVHQMDITTAFLNGELEEEVYCSQPPGFADGPRVCLLLKAIYGLKQAPRVWHQCFKSALESQGFSPAVSDSSLFMKLEKHGGVTYICVYVDDMLIASLKLQDVEAAKTMVSSAFRATDLGEAKYFLGMDITRDRAARTLKLGQSRLTRELLDSSDMVECRVRGIPISLGVSLVKGAGEPLKSSGEYMHLVGTMNYLATCTRPDISQPVGVLSRFMSCPTSVHLAVAKGVLRYLSGTANFGIMFGGAGGVEAYSDADYDGCEDTRHSTSGYAFIAYGGAIHWSSKRQSTVALSTTEAEFIAAAGAAREALWIRKLLGDLEVDFGGGALLIYGDNQSALKLIRNPILSLRSKHIDIAHQFVREKEARKAIAFQYISTDLMAADMLTKPVNKSKLVFCMNRLGIC
jgi:hypothetical protein